MNTNPSREVLIDTTRKLWGKLVNVHFYKLSHYMNVPKSKMVHGATLPLILFSKLSILSQLPLWIFALMKLTYLVFNVLPVKTMFLVLYKATVR